MGPLLGPSLGPISPFPLAALKLDEIDQNALLPNQKTVQSDSFAPFFVRQYHNICPFHGCSRDRRLGLLPGNPGIEKSRDSRAFFLE